MRLANRVAIITGGASGIGEQTAIRLSEEGAAVAVLDVNVQGAEAVCKQIVAGGGQALALGADVSDDAQVHAAVDQVLARFQRIDILFNNAGIGFSSTNRYKMASVIETPPADWDAILGINLRSMFLLSKYVLPVMQRQKQGTVINNSSIMAVTGYPGADAYTAAKGGIIALTRSMAAEFGPDGIRVNCITPGTIRTPIQGHFADDVEFQKEVSLKIPLRRTADPREVANVVLFLASDEASFVSGAIIPVDGGQAL